MTKIGHRTWWVRLLQDQVAHRYILSAVVPEVTWRVHCVFVVGTLIL
jgi:hypothetical protein